MPQFITISPTNIPGNKAYAWRNFLEGGYIAIGWGHTDYTDYSIDEIVEDIEAQRFRNQGEAVQSFKKLLSLKPGDVVAVNNVNHGLFGIGRIDLAYKFKTKMHDTGSENPDHFYSHYRKVKWIVTEFKTINELMLPGESLGHVMARWENLKKHYLPIFLENWTNIFKLIIIKLKQ